MASHDSELFKDKIEVSLDGRQIFYLFFGGALIATLVFVLGVMVGRRVEARAVVETGSLASDPLAALDRLEGKGSDLAFASALRGDDVSLGAVDATLAPAIGGPASAAQTPVTQDEDGDGAKEQGEAEAAELAKADAAAKKAAEAKAAADKAQAEKAKRAAEQTELDNESNESRAAKLAMVKPPVQESPAESEPEAKRDMRFTLQVGSFQDKSEADDFFRSLDKNGYAPYMVEAEVPGKGTYFRVRIGGYPSFESAIDAKKAFEDKEHVIAYVTRLKK